MDWILRNYLDGDKLTRVAQERYAEDPQQPPTAAM
jgi:hypothetical protein